MYSASAAKIVETEWLSDSSKKTVHIDHILT